MIIPEVFGFIRHFVKRNEKLIIDSIVKESPGGIKFKTPRRNPPSSTEPTKASPLQKTKKIIAAVMEKNDVWAVAEQLTVENGAIDPAFLGILKEVFVSGPFDTLIRLHRSGLLKMGDSDTESNVKKRRRQ